MIQRVQSIYLLLAAIFFCTAFFLPFLTIDMSGSGVLQPALSDGRFDYADNIGILGLAVLGSVLSIAAIFMFSNRLLQSKLSALITLVAALMFVLAAIAGQALRTHIAEGDSVQFGLGWMAPLGAILFSRLAAQAIRKDEQLVKSMDRLR
jgi:hypothetical protein